MADVNSTCTKLLEAMHTQAEQELGEKKITPFLDTLGDYDSTEDLVKDLFDTTEYNNKWKTAHEANKQATTDDEKDANDAAEIRAKQTIVYMCSWKRALLKFSGKMSDVDYVYGNGMNYINTGAQSIEATRMTLDEPETTTEPESGK